MKKSTLITTIAMIVVVVVALSTATYAWFTSSATTTATANMVTTASSDFTLTVLNNTTGQRAWSEGATGVGIALTPHALLAPTQKIATTIGFSESQIEPSSVASFYGADYKTATTAQLTADAAQVGIDALRVTNITSADKNLYLYIVIAVDADNMNANTIYAAQATSFYITSSKTSESVYSSAAPTTPTTSSAVAGKWTNKYYVATTTSGSQDDILTKGSEQTEEGTFVSTALVNGSEAANEQSISVRPAYNGSTNGFAHATADQPALGITAGQYVIAYVINFGTLTPNESIVLGVYNWIDGWVADNAAGSANYNVTYAFTKDLTQYIVTA